MVSSAVVVDLIREIDSTLVVRTDIDDSWLMADDVSCVVVVVAVGSRK